MPRNITQKLIESHLREGTPIPGEEIGIHIDQTLTQDATGTLVMLELEAMQLDRVRTDVSVQYVDHNLLEVDHKNPDDHLFLQSACRRFGVWYSRPGNGVSHPVHQQRFGKPGGTLLGSDSHTPAAGAIGMLAIGAGGLEVALAMAGEPFYFRMPQVWGVRLVGQLPDWVSAKDIILEMLRRHDVDGGVGRILEYHGPALKHLSAMDRHVIANMGTELGATSSVFPSDDETRRYLTRQGRENDWQPLMPDPQASYDIEEEIDLATLVPLVAKPSSPGNVVPVAEIANQQIYQAYIGSSANPGFRDFAVAAETVRGQEVHPRVSFDINPSSRQILLNLLQSGHLTALLEAGGRLHQAGCNGCIGMGQAPATDAISLRTVPRNFPGRSGTREDQVYLVSPETAAASALTGVITDPRTLDRAYPRVTEPEELVIHRELLEEPPSGEEPVEHEIVKGPNIASLPQFDSLPEELELEILLKVGDDISTDEIMPAGSRILPYRSNIPEISKFCFEAIDEQYASRGAQMREEEQGHAILGGENYGQGSSREHAALAPRYLGLRVVLAKSFARIHRQNLVNFGVLPLTISNACYEQLDIGDRVHFEKLHDQLQHGKEIQFTSSRSNQTLTTQHQLSKRQREILLRGGLINYMKDHLQEA